MKKLKFLPPSHVAAPSGDIFKQTVDPTPTPPVAFDVTREKTAIKSDYIGEDEQEKFAPYGAPRDECKLKHATLELGESEKVAGTTM